MEAHLKINQSSISPEWNYKISTPLHVTKKKKKIREDLFIYIKVRGRMLYILLQAKIF